jgi:hypothetical protein
VGIDHYILPNRSSAYPFSARTKARLALIHGRPSRLQITDLEGAVNDATQMRDLLIYKYRFKPENIVLLTDAKATADRILDTLQTHLIDAAQSGDVSFFYYAGHGSRIRNTLTRNSSGMDSTLIPADSLLGVPDIRSKELDRIYLKAKRKNMALTLVEDSCFSGTGIRGPRPGGRIRATDPDPQVFVSEALDAPLPEEEGVLFFSASQDYQPAQELYDDRLGKHGAFTWAFLQVLAASDVNERVDRIFQRTRALMQSKVDDQEPVVLQSGGRNERGLFGQASDPVGAATAAVGYVQPGRDMLELNSGITMGLASGSELRRVRPVGPAVRIRIIEVNGPSSANAQPIAPAKISAIHVSDLFQIDKLVVPDKEFLKVYVGGSVPFALLVDTARLAADLRAMRRIELIDDPIENTPTHVLLWNGEQKNWQLVENRQGGAVLLSAASPSADTIAATLSGHSLKARLAIMVPPSEELLAGLSFDSQGNIVSLTKSLENADYFLLGRISSSGAIEYAWARPSVTQEDLRSREGLHHHEQPVSLSGWPRRSDWSAVDQSALVTAVARKLTQQGLDLARIAGWLQLQTPVPDDFFPYSIALRDENGDLSEVDLTAYHTYKISLRRDPLSRQTSVTPRRVYIFVVDSFGKSTLVYGSNLDNEFPRKGTTALPEEMDLNVSVDITPPWGVDNYFLLTSVQPIDNPEAIFNSEGVRTRGEIARGPLEKLLQNRAAGTRGALSGVPTNWSIDRKPFRSLDRNATQ